MLSQSNEKPLLQIVLSDINAVPVVLYKGEEIKGKVRISFDWQTNNQSSPYIHIEHVDDLTERINTKIVQHNHPIMEDVGSSKVFVDGEEVVKLVCCDCGVDVKGKRISLEGKSCIYCFNHNTTIVPLDKE
ncbi:Uncharacterized protein BC88300_04634 [Bacillus cytotoxicus]|nr:Uncharacterized protein BC88300_04634 [Bacillus cytotoxicus]